MSMSFCSMFNSYETSDPGSQYYKTLYIWKLVPAPELYFLEIPMEDLNVPKVYVYHSNYL